MKKINLNLIQLPENKHWSHRFNQYQIFVTSGLKYTFSSLKQAKEIENSLHYWINDILNLTNEAYIGCFTDYRRLWLYFDTDIMDGRKCENLLTEIGRLLDNSHNAYSPGSGLFYVIKTLRVSAENMLFIYELLTLKQKARNNYQALKEYDYKIKVLKMITSELERPPGPQ